ncbi:MAG: zinc-binding alcohol dehydrogenase, partial [Actinobacteria bacterium]|nr:zinc-binding alcohol dehydrogenase [Actinomycetota bacterium]
MKQVLQPRLGPVVVRDVPLPPCPPGAVLVRTRFSLISAGTERTRVEESGKSLLAKARERPELVRNLVTKARREGLSATRETIARRLEETTPVGYSSAGVVLEVGGAVRGLKPGDRVACAGAGHANHAEYVSMPANLCARVPANVALDVAAFTTVAAVALHGVRLAEVELGDRVAVVGCGLVGQIACRLLACAGAEVHALDIDARRLEDTRASGAAAYLSSESGAAERVAAATGGRGVDAVLICAAASVSEPLHLAAQIARDRGNLVLVGAVPIEMPRAPLFQKELSFRVSRSYGPGRYDPEYEERGLDYPIGY